MVPGRGLGEPVIMAPTQPVLGLKIDVDTFQGLRHGVPRLLRLLERRGVRATFYVPAGPDRSGRAALRILRQRGFVQKMLRTGGLRLYGLRTALRGTVLPGIPMTRAREELRAIPAGGHELGVHGWDHVAWHDAIDRVAYARVVALLEQARAELAEASGVVPTTEGAPGWHCTFGTLHAVDSLGFRWGSDTRGVTPFLPRVDGYTFRTPQLPTTLPTLDEIARRGDRPQTLVERYLSWIGERPWNVLTAHAEVEGSDYEPFLDGLLATLQDRGVRVLPLGDLVDELPRDLPVHGIVRSTREGRAGLVSLQD